MRLTPLKAAAILAARVAARGEMVFETLFATILADAVIDIVSTGGLLDYRHQEEAIKRPAS